MSPAHWNTMPRMESTACTRNCSSPQDELCALDAEDATNLIADPAYAAVRSELIRSLGLALPKDPRWVGFWAELRIARLHDLPKVPGTCSSSAGRFYG